MCCLSEEEKNTIVLDKEIQKILREQKKRERREIKVLLLGRPIRGVGRHP
jgi:guanine nucleotide-binding protein G(q) subunit alpha